MDILSAPEQILKFFTILIVPLIKIILAVLVMYVLLGKGRLQSFFESSSQYVLSTVAKYIKQFSPRDNIGHVTVTILILIAILLYGRVSSYMSYLIPYQISYFGGDLLVTESDESAILAIMESFPAIHSASELNEAIDQIIASKQGHHVAGRLHFAEKAKYFALWFAYGRSLLVLVLIATTFSIAKLSSENRIIPKSLLTIIGIHLCMLVLIFGFSRNTINHYLNKTTYAKTILLESGRLDAGPISKETLKKFDEWRERAEKQWFFTIGWRL